jgi:surface antigen
MNFKHMIKSLFLLTLIASINVSRAELSLNLDLVDNSPATQFSDEDWLLLKAKAKEILEDKREGVSDFWVNNTSGHSGTVKSVNSTFSDNGTECRQLEFVTKITNSTTTTLVSICKQRGGQWQEVGDRHADVEQEIEPRSPENNGSSILYTDGVESTEMRAKVISQTSEKCRTLADNVAELKGQPLKRSVARDIYETECLLK